MSNNRDGVRRPSSSVRGLERSWPRKSIESDGEVKVKGYGLLVYGLMTMAAGGMLAEAHPVFILVAASGLFAFIFGVRTLAQRAQRM